MTEKPYTDDDLRAEAARQHAAHGPGSSPERAYAAMLDARIESSLTADGSGPTWTEAVDRPDLGAPAAAIHALIEGAAAVSEWAINLGADGLDPSGYVVTVGPAARPLARLHFAFRPDVPEETRIALVARLDRILTHGL